MIRSSTQTASIDIVLLCSFTPDFSTLPITRSYFCFPWRFDKFRFYCNLFSNLYFVIKDEQGAAAQLSVALDDELGGYPVQHRVVSIFNMIFPTSTSILNFTLVAVLVRGKHTRGD